MAAKKVKNKKTKSASTNGHIATNPVGGGSTTTKSNKGVSSFHLSAIPGIIIAIAAAFYSRSGDSDGNRSTQDVSRQLLSPKEGSWTDGYYTTRPIPDQSYPSTHALLYPNGGIGEPTMVHFTNDDEFTKLGRLYNDKGQIVQSPFHFANGTALYRSPTKQGTHFQWPAVHVGYKRPVSGLFGGNGKQIELETLTEPSENSQSSDPRIFYIHNFLSLEEADEFVRFSTAEENPYKMAPSTG